MSILFRKYGPVWVASSLLVAGSITWVGIENYTRGERVAELLAGYRERSLVAYSKADETPALFTSEPTNWTSGVTIGPFILWSDIYEEILDPARTMFTQGGGTYHSADYDVAADPLWVLNADAFYDGAWPVTVDYSPEWAVVASNTYSWPLVSNYGSGTPTTYYVNTYNNLRDAYANNGFNLDYEPSGVVWEAVYTTDTRWNWPGKIFQSGVSRTNLAFSTGLLTLRENMPHGHVGLPLALVNNAAGPWADQGLGDNFYRYECEATNSVGQITSVTGSYMTKTNLLQAFWALRSMTTTVDIVSIQTATVATNEVYSITAFITDADYASGSGAVPAFPAMSKHALYTDLAADISISAVTNSGGSINAALVDHSYSTGEQAWTEYIDTFDYYYTAREYSASYDGVSRVYRGVELPRPSEFACASGYVARVQIFGVFSALGENYYTPPSSLDFYPMLQPSAWWENEWWENEENEWWENEWWDSVTLQEDTTQTNVYDIGLALCYLPEVPAGDKYSGGGFHIYQRGAARPVRFVTALLHDTHSPGSRPSFDLDYGASLVLPGEDYCSTGWLASRTIDFDDAPDVETNEQPSNKSVQEYESACYAESRTYQLWLLGFVVVTDWNWKHCNTNSPFAPESYTPDWIIDNEAPF